MKKRDIGTLAAGMMLGAALTGGAAAAGVLAEPSWQNFYVDGRQVHMTAYNIAGSNYVKLRDIGQAVGFNVYWQNGVQVDSDAPYTGEAPTQVPQTATNGIRVSSVKGNSLKAGDRSGLIIGPGGLDYAVSSSDPAVITIEKVSGSYVAVAKSAGTATITVKNGSGETGGLTLTVAGGTESSTAAGQAPDSGIDLTANMEIRQEMVRLINQLRRENGVPELPVSEALMNATQDISTHHFTKHTPYEGQAVRAYGWTNGGSNNLTCFNRASEGDIAQRAVQNWINSTPHLRTMLQPDVASLGVGVTIADDFAYCHLYIGNAA